MSRYDTDFYTWTQEQAALLREGALAELDLANLAEEIESVGRSDKRSLTSELIRLLQHLLNWRYQPERRSPSWQDTITQARTMIDLIIEDSPSLHGLPAERLAIAYPRARRQASRETRLPLVTFPEACPWTLAQVLDDDLYPSAQP